MAAMTQQTKELIVAEAHKAGDEWWNTSYQSHDHARAALYKFIESAIQKIVGGAGEPADATPVKRGEEPAIAASAERLKEAKHFHEMWESYHEDGEHRAGTPAPPTIF